MSRSYKKYPNKMHRKPKGAVRAEINEARKGAVPPTSWDDIGHDRQCRLPERVAFRMHQSGKSDEEIIKHLRSKFCMRQGEAEGVLPMKLYVTEGIAVSRTWRHCRCEKCEVIRRIKKW